MKRLKLIVSMVVMFLIVGAGSVMNAEASSGITIYVNGEQQSYSNLAVIDNGRTLVPLRGIFESLGASVYWDEPTKTVIASRDGVNMSLEIGSAYAVVNARTVTIDVPAKIVNGRTLVPLRFVSEVLGDHVHWDNSTRMITIHSNTGTDSVYLPIADFHNVFSGMTKQQLKNVEKATFVYEDATRLEYADKLVFDDSATVIYEFSNNRLSAINVYHDIVSNNDVSLTIMEEYYRTIYEVLIDIYESPVYEDYDWVYDEEGAALKAFWETASHDILLISLIDYEDRSDGGIRIEFVE